MVIKEMTFMLVLSDHNTMYMNNSRNMYMYANFVRLFTLPACKIIEIWSCMVVLSDRLHNVYV